MDREGLEGKVKAVSLRKKRRTASVDKNVGKPRILLVGI